MFADYLGVIEMLMQSSDPLSTCDDIKSICKLGEPKGAMMVRVVMTKLTPYETEMVTGEQVLFVVGC
jgi:hypothetical protein